jgi:hypothetical protein
MFSMPWVQMSAISTEPSAAYARPPSLRPALCPLWILDYLFEVRHTPKMIRQRRPPSNAAGCTRATSLDIRGIAVLTLAFQNNDMFDWA